MLVLSRKCGERIMLGENIELVVVEIQGSRVRLGVAAPQGVRIRRGELQLRIANLSNELAPVAECACSRPQNRRGAKAGS